ncbi:hypothetical protein ACFWPV_09780 [Streptomyces uncialis]|uniref:hypothetical protein n=1 Tax=Streptomyces uncialis TaxID=1048205 RepID=UPI00364A923F
MDDTPPSITADVTCRTPGCTANGITFRVGLYAAPAPPTYRAHCARCDTTITDIVEVPGA